MIYMYDLSMVWHDNNLTIYVSGLTNGIQVGSVLELTYVRHIRRDTTTWDEKTKYTFTYIGDNAWATGHYIYYDCEAARLCPMYKTVHQIMLDYLATHTIEKILE